MSNNDGNIDYSTYTYPELLQALNSIDARSFPKNYANLEHAIENISPAMREAYEAEDLAISESLDKEIDWGDSLDEPEQTDPEVEFIKHLITGIGVAAISAYLLWVDDIVIPLGEQMTISLKGLGRTLASAAFLFAITVPMTFVINYVDDRDNQKMYRLYALFAESLATGLLIFAWVVSGQ